MTRVNGMKGIKRVARESRSDGWVREAGEGQAGNLGGEKGESF